MSIRLRNPTSANIKILESLVDRKLFAKCLGKLYGRPGLFKLEKCRKPKLTHCLPNEILFVVRRLSLGNSKDSR